MRRFRLDREVDETGVSGTGRGILRGVLTPAGKVFVEWREPRASMGIYSSLDEFIQIHVMSHPGSTTFHWEDEDGRERP